MDMSEKYIVGTSGYSFPDWVGNFYPEGTKREQMLELYVKRFEAVEVNYTYYRMPTAKTLDKMARTSPEAFTFWVKANRATTHEQDRSVAREFLENLEPLRATDKLAGVLLQFPQSFHRTVVNRTYLASAIEDFQSAPLAVEFRHCSWEHPATVEGLRQRDVTVVIPDAPDLQGLFRPAPAVTNRTGYLRLHSRDASKWYAGAAERYDYNYSREELLAMLASWQELADKTDRVFAFFNNCHRGQAAENARAFRRILGQID